MLGVDAGNSRLLLDQLHPIVRTKAERGRIRSRDFERIQTPGLVAGIDRMLDRLDGWEIDKTGCCI